jgi:hypothetical protein
MNYKDYLKSNEWKKKRNQVRYWHGKKCHCCLEKYKDIHHKTYKNLGNENQKIELTPLCRGCHEKIHIFCKENNFNVWKGTEMYISKNKKKKPLKWENMTIYERSRYLTK